MEKNNQKLQANSSSMISSALLVLNGDLPRLNLLNELSKQSNLIICTDGAASAFCKCGVMPDIIIGDLDSLQPDDLARLSNTCRVIEKPSQSATDFEKALDYLLEQTIQEISIVGLKGGRLDHSITNLSILYNYHQHFNIKLFDSYGSGQVLHSERNKIEIEATAGTIVSLIPLDHVAGIKTAGLLYPLNNESLKFGGRNGQSNQMITDTASVELETGVLIVYVL